MTMFERAERLELLAASIKSQIEAGNQAGEIDGDLKRAEVILERTLRSLGGIPPGSTE